MQNIKVGVVYLHHLCEDSFYGAQKIIKFGMPRQETFHQHAALLLLLTSNIWLKRQYVTHWTQMTVRRNYRTYEQFYDRVIGAFVEYYSNQRRICSFHFTNSFDWRTSCRKMTTSIFDNPQKSWKQTHRCTGLYIIHEEADTPYLRQSNMRIKHHKLKHKYKKIIWQRI